MDSLNSLQKLMAERGIREDKYPHWTQTFQPELRREQIDEDHDAWMSVTGTLLFIISIGVSLALITVYLCSQ